MNTFKLNWKKNRFFNLPNRWLPSEVHRVSVDTRYERQDIVERPDSFRR
jgi:hypothetical protein